MESFEKKIDAKLVLSILAAGIMPFPAWWWRRP